MKSNFRKKKYNSIIHIIYNYYTYLTSILVSQIQHWHFESRCLQFMNLLYYLKERGREVFQLWKQNYLFSHYLDKVVSQNIPKCSKSVCHRLAAVDLAVIPFLAFPNIIICCYPKHFLLKSCTKKYTTHCKDRLYLQMEM